MNKKFVEEVIKKGIVLPSFKLIDILEREIEKIGKRKGISKFDLFPFLKADFYFRCEVGSKKYKKLIHLARSLPEKCKAHVRGEECRDCATQRKGLCVVNVIGIIADSDILPHHGFEYSDLLIKTGDETKLLVPVIAKGPEKMTFRNDRRIRPQLREKLRDELISVVVVACSGQIARKLLIDLEHMARIENKDLIFLTEKDLAQFLYRLEILN